MTKLLLLGLLSLSLLITTSGCAPPSAIARTNVLQLPAASSRAPVQAADLSATLTSRIQPDTTGNLPKIVTDQAGALDRCNADKARVAKALGITPPS